MDQTRGLSAGHGLQGPHREQAYGHGEPVHGEPVHGEPEVPAGFVPLGLVLEPLGLRVEVTRPHAIVGRHSQADVRLALPDVSRRHCRLFFQNGHWRVSDLNSLNGIFVNGERMHEAALYEGDHLQLGKFIFTVENAPPRAGGPKSEVIQRIVDMID